MKRLTMMILPALAVSLFALTAPACGGKKDQPNADEPSADQPKAAEPKAAEPKAAEPKAAEPKAAEPKADAPKADKVEEYIKFDVMHHQTEKGMVNGHFGKFSLVKANVNLSKPDTAMAVISIDLSSVSTGIAKRDGHVKSSDFFDVAKFAAATLTVNGVKAAENVDSYTANATLDLHGVTKSFPVSFKVTSKRADGSIVVEGEHKGLVRGDFGIGAAPEATNVAAVIDAVKVRLVLANK